MIFKKISLLFSVAFFAISGGAQSLCLSQTSLLALENSACHQVGDISISIYEKKNKSDNIFEKERIFIARSNHPESLKKWLSIDSKNRYKTNTTMIPSSELIERRVPLAPSTLEKMGLHDNKLNRNFYGEYVEYKKGREADQEFLVLCITSLDLKKSPYTSITQCSASPQEDFSSLKLFGNIL